MYLGPLAEDGLVGMGLQVAIYLLVIRTLFRKHRFRNRGDHVAVYVIPLLAGIVAGYLVGGLTISYRHSSILGVLFCMSAGIAYGYDPESSEEESESVPEASTRG